MNENIINLCLCMHSDISLAGCVPLVFLRFSDEADLALTRRDDELELFRLNAV